MEITLSWQMAAVFVAIVVNTGLVIYNAGKMSSLINHLHECIHRLDNEIKNKENSIVRAHRRIDEIMQKG